MKKRTLFIATLLVVVATTVAVVSCKKENQDALLYNIQPAKPFTPPVVDDMNAYLKDFKQKMKESQYSKYGETLDLEEAAWYLSSVANYDFANANVEFTDLRYDTLYYQINVTNGRVALSDLNMVYQSMASDIDAFYQSLDLQNKHFRFIGASVSGNGQVRVTLITTYNILDHTWYFGDDWVAAVICYDLFDEYTNYVWNTTAIDTLEYAINLLEGRNYILPGEHSTEREYYVYTADVVFNYETNIDPYGSSFLANSRIFAEEGDTYAVPTLDINTMCYCLDSYIGLPFEYLQLHYGISATRPVHWDIDYSYYHPEGYKWHKFCHILTVKLGLLVSNGDPIIY